MQASMSPCKGKSLLFYRGIFNAFALTGRIYSRHLYPGRCPGLGASGLSARFNRTGRYFLSVLTAQAFFAFHRSSFLVFRPSSSLRVSPLKLFSVSPLKLSLRFNPQAFFAFHRSSFLFFRGSTMLILLFVGSTIFIFLSSLLGFNPRVQSPKVV